MKIGIVGLPKSGKTTIYSLLVQTGIKSITPGEPHIGVVKVPDPRLEYLAQLFQPKKVTPATVEFHDFLGLTKGTGKGGGGAQLIPQLRLMDALLEVVRAFEDTRVPHPEGDLDPFRDIATLESEFLFADLEIVEKRMERIEQALKKEKGEEHVYEQAILKRCKERLEADIPLRDVDFTEEDRRVLRGFQFLTFKPLVLLINKGEEPLKRETLERLKGFTLHRDTVLIELNGKVELELAELSPEDAEEFRREMGLDAPGRPRLIQPCLELLHIITFYTFVGEEVRAWTIPEGTNALKAAGTIHSDMERGFIRAEVIAFEDLKGAGSLAAARKKGLLRLEGKEYPVADGDLLTIRFHV